MDQSDKCCTYIIYSYVQFIITTIFVFDVIKSILSPGAVFAIRQGSPVYSTVQSRYIACRKPTPSQFTSLLPFVIFTKIVETSYKLISTHVFLLNVKRLYHCFEV